MGQQVLAQAARLFPCPSRTELGEVLASCCWVSPYVSLRKNKCGKLSLTKKYLKFANVGFHMRTPLRAFGQQSPRQGSEGCCRSRQVGVGVGLRSLPRLAVPVAVPARQLCRAVPNEAVDAVQLPECQHLHALAPFFWHSQLRNQ